MWVPDGYNQAIPLSVEKFVLSGKHDYHKHFFYPHFLGTKPAPGSVCRVKPQRRAGQLCHSALLPAKIHFIFQNPALASRALGKHRCFNPLPHVVDSLSSVFSWLTLVWWSHLPIAFREKGHGGSNFGGFLSLKMVLFYLHG